MSNEGIIRDLERSGHLDVLINKGILPSTYTRYLTINERVQIEITRKVKKMQAYQNVADEMGISIDTVRIAVKWCRS